MSNRRSHFYQIPSRYNKRLKSPLTNHKIIKFESIPAKISGMKILGAKYQWDAYDANYYNHWRMDNKCWKTYRKTQYRI
jgi:hypothetical protein